MACALRDDEDQYSWTGYQDGPDCLRDNNECPRRATTCAKFWRFTGVRLRHELILHDLIIQITCRGLQYWIIVLGIIDAVVYAHNHHRQNKKNIGFCLKIAWRRVSVWCALAPAYAHAFQSWRQPRRPDNNLIENFIRTTTHQSGSAYKGWAVFTDGGTHTDDGETTAVWGPIARSLPGVCYVIFGPVITAEVHVAYARASQHTNDTAEISGIIEPLCFLSSIGCSGWISGLRFLWFQTCCWRFVLARYRHGRMSS